MKISGFMGVIGCAIGLVVVGSACGGAASDGPGAGDETAPGGAGAGRPGGLQGTFVGRYRIGGVEQPILVTRNAHPRGGWQVHAYVGHAREKPATELTDAAGNPIVAFVATDTRPSSHVSVSCTSHGLRVLEATPTVPSGVLFAWDIERTTYRVDGNGAHRRGQREVGKSVPERTLRTKWPALAQDRMFVGCAPYRPSR